MIKSLRIPYGTLLLVAIMSLTWWLWQKNDTQRLQEAIKIYEQEKLFPLEWQNYLSHLHQQGQKPQADHLESLTQQQRPQKIAALIQNLWFMEELTTTDARFWGNDVYKSWHQSRETLNQQVNSLSTIKYGFVAHHQRPLTTITYGFLHNSVWHWLLGVLLLLVVGSALEQRLSSFYLVLGFCVAEIVIALLYTLISPTALTFIPLVGSTGATFALGCGYLRLAPSVRWLGTIAASLLIAESIHLIWLTEAKPIWPWLVCSALTGAMFFVGVHFGYKWLPTPHKDKDLIEGPEESETSNDDDSFLTDLDNYYRQLTAFNFDTAKDKLAKITAHYPNRLPVLEQNYHLSKLSANPNSTYEQLLKVMQLKRSDAAYLALTRELYLDYQQQPNVPELPDSLLLDLLSNLCQLQAWDTLKILLDDIRKRGLKDPAIVKALRTLASGLDQQGDSKNGQHYRELANNLDNQLNQPAAD